MQPAMPARCMGLDLIAAHGDPGVVNASEGDPLDHQGYAEPWGQSLVNGPNPAQVAGALLAGVGGKPDVERQRVISGPQQFDHGQHRRYAQAVIAQARPVYALALALDLQRHFEIEYRISVGR